MAHLAISILLIYIVYQVALLARSRAMKRKEKLFREEGIEPSGSGLHHGMYVDREGEVQPTEEPSRSWYSRLD